MEMLMLFLAVLVVLLAYAGPVLAMATTTTSTGSKIRCTHDRIQSMRHTFGADATGGTWDLLGSTVVHIPEDVDYSENAEGAVYFEIEDVLAPKTTGQTWARGEQLYYNATTDKFSNTLTGMAASKKAGAVLEAAGTAATEGRAYFSSGYSV